MYENSLPITGYLSSMNTCQLISSRSIDVQGSPTINYPNQITAYQPCAMTPHQAQLCYYFNKFHQEQVVTRKTATNKVIRDVVKIADDILKEVETQEPRFVSSLKYENTSNNGKFEGLRVLSPTKFEIILFLNQMGVFNFVDDGGVPGCAVLKLSDGRKRSMSLWVEFITASGYLSARKIRSRFQSLVAQAVDNSGYRDIVQLVSDSTEVRLKIQDRYTLQITPAFRCAGMWPRSASHWPLSGLVWPGMTLSTDVKAEGFNLLSRESAYMRDKPGSSSAEGDAWLLDFHEAEERLLSCTGRKRCLGILKTFCERCLESSDSGPVTNYQMKTLLLYECEKHPLDTDWIDTNIPDRINGILLQLICCLQNRRCPHYFLASLDLFRGKSSLLLDQTAKQVWSLLRDLITSPRSLENL